MRYPSDELRIAVLRSELCSDETHSDMFFWWLDDVDDEQPEEQQSEPEQAQPEQEEQEPEQEKQEGEPDKGEPADSEDDESDSEKSESEEGGEPKEQEGGEPQGDEQPAEGEPSDQPGEQDEEQQSGEQEGDPGEGDADGEGKPDAAPQQAPDADATQNAPQSESSDGPDTKEDLKDAKGDAQRKREAEERRKQAEEDAPETAVTSFFANGGPTAPITAKGSNNVIVREFLRNIKLAGGDTPKRKGIHPKKALVALVKAPHTVFDQKKTLKRDPKIYAIIDTSSAYYDDRGKLLEEFAETCDKFNVQVWRAPSLGSPFTHKNKTIEADSHLEFAQKAGIPGDSVVIFVGSCCQGGSHHDWKKKDMEAFKKAYKPVVINPFPGTQTCGCRPKTLAYQANWTMVNNVTSVEDLRNFKLARL